MTESEIKLVERLWASGKGVGEIARLLPYKEYISIREIRELKRNGVLKGRSGKSQANTQAKVLQAYNDGITSPYDLAEMFGLKVSTVNWILGNSKLDRKRPKHNYKQYPLCEKTQQIITEIQSGKPLHEIAKAHGTSRQYVHKIKNKYVKEKL